MVEPFLEHWLSWYVQPNGPENELNTYVFPLAILITTGVKLALPQITWVSYKTVLETLLGRWVTMMWLNMHAQVSASFYPRAVLTIELKPIEFSR